MECAAGCRGTVSAASAPAITHCVIGDEPRLAHNRVLLSAVLAQEIGSSDIELKPACWWRDRGVTLRYGVRASEIDATARTVRLEDGARLSFSKLVLAIGSQPIRLAIPGMELPGVLTFRDVDDVNRIAAKSGVHKAGHDESGTARRRSSRCSPDPVSLPCGA